MLYSSSSLRRFLSILFIVVVWYCCHDSSFAEVVAAAAAAAAAAADISTPTTTTTTGHQQADSDSDSDSKEEVPAEDLTRPEEYLTTRPQLPIPHYVLVEEHHHVVPHLIQFVKDGILNSHSDLSTVNDEEVNENGAILIHIDSHADMGLTPGLNAMYELDHLKSKLKNKAPKLSKNEIHSLLEHTAINDFLLLLGYIGIVEHIIFIEPPWSILLKDTHYTTSDISICVVEQSDSISSYAAYASIRTSKQSNIKLSSKAIIALDEMMADADEPVFIVTHDELLKRCSSSSSSSSSTSSSSGSQIRTIRFSVLPMNENTSNDIKELLDKDHTTTTTASTVSTASTAKNNNKKKKKLKKDIILDIDLDAYATTSPGAMALIQTGIIPSYDILTRIYHTVHNNNWDDHHDGYDLLNGKLGFVLCDFNNPRYWETIMGKYTKNSFSYCKRNMTIIC